jgi:hypothetical protein
MVISVGYLVRLAVIFDRPDGSASDARVKLTELSQFSNVGIKGVLGVLRLDLDSLLNRLGFNELLKEASRVLERYLGVISDLAGDGLQAFAHLTV